MRRPELKVKRARGFLLIVAILVLVVIAVAIAAMGNMTSADVRASSGNAQSEQAYFVAISGLEVATREFANGTACASLTYPGGAIASTQVGTGTFATSGTLYPSAFTATVPPLTSIANNNNVPQIPLSFGSGSITDLATHGEVLIDNEFITYSGRSPTTTCSLVAAPCLTGVLRATNGTTIATHNAGAVITQLPQCVIRSTGTVQPAIRVVESTVALKSGGASNLFNGASVPLTNGVTASLTGGAWSPGLPAGDNYVIAIVTFSETTNTAGVSSVATGNLQINATFPVSALDASTSTITFGNGTTPSNTAFPQETQVLLAKHTGALATATYNVQVVTPTISGTTSARVQILVINGITAANASFTPSGANQVLDTVAKLAFSGALPAGDNIIIAQVQLDGTQNGAAGNRTVTAGNLAIRRGNGTAGPVLMSNTYDINLRPNGNANQGTGFLLLALDPGAVATTQYSVTGLASGNKVNASASLLVFNGFSAAWQPPVPGPPTAPLSVPFGTTATPLGSVADTYQAGERVVLTGIQYQNPSGATRNMAAGNETITLNGSPVSGPASANAYNWALCNVTVGCDDFFSGLLWRGSPVAATPTLGVQSLTNGAGMTGAANILTIKLGGSGVRQINRMEIYP